MTEEEKATHDVIEAVFYDDEKDMEANKTH